jgi:hypothetical protein
MLEAAGVEGAASAVEAEADGGISGTPPNASDLGEVSVGREGAEFPKVPWIPADIADVGPLGRTLGANTTPPKGLATSGVRTPLVWPREAVIRMRRRMELGPQSHPPVPCSVNDPGPRLLIENLRRETTRPGLPESADVNVILQVEPVLLFEIIALHDAIEMRAERLADRRRVRGPEVPGYMRTEAGPGVEPVAEGQGILPRRVQSELGLLAMFRRPRVVKERSRAAFLACQCR